MNQFLYQFKKKHSEMLNHTNDNFNNCDIYNFKNYDKIFGGQEIARYRASKSPSLYQKSQYPWLPV